MAQPGFPFGFRMATPEEVAEMEKNKVKAATEDEKRFLAMLPHLREARQHLREAAALGCGGSRFEGIRRELAVLIDDVETSLMRPP